MINIYWQRIIKLLLFWSVFFFIFLLILEDLKPFLVRVHFIPHWLIPIILILFIVQIFSHDNYQPTMPQQKRLLLFGWLVAICCWVIVYLFFNNQFLGLIIGCIIFVLVKIYLKKIKRQFEF